MEPVNWCRFWDHPRWIFPRIRSPGWLGLLSACEPWCWFIKTYKTGWFCSCKCWYMSYVYVHIPAPWWVFIWELRVLSWILQQFSWGRLTGNPGFCGNWFLDFWDVSNNSIQQEYDMDMNHNNGDTGIPIHQEQSVCQQKWQAVRTASSFCQTEQK